MRIGSLCSGYGGLDMAVQEVLGGSVAWHVENDPNAAAILDHHWPTVPNHGDLTATDWTRVEPVDVLTAGYPCQPFSHAGKRKGPSDERHLWPYVAGAIGALRPRLVVLENVRGHVSLGLDAVVGDLSRLGYDARWGVVRAADAGAPHGRARVFITATDADQPGLEGREPAGLVGGLDAAVGRDDAAPDAASAERRGPQSDLLAAPAGRTAEPRECASEVAWGQYEPAIRRWERLTRPAPAPTEPGAKGQPRLSPRFVEWLMGLPAGHVTDVPISRNAQLKALGNGVVPQQAALALRLLLPDLAMTA